MATNCQLLTFKAWIWRFVGWRLRLNQLTFWRRSDKWRSHAIRHSKIPCQLLSIFYVVEWL